MFFSQYNRMNRTELANLIFERLVSEKESLRNEFETSKSGIGYFFIDNVLPEEIALQLHAAFPKTDEMVLKKSLREDKYVAAQMDRYNPAAFGISENIAKA
jgi:hypothetical protein